VRRLATYAPPLLVGLFALPFILRQNSWWEWGNAYWLLERQTEYVSAHGVPTLFLHNFSGAYNPFYVFYSGFTFSLLAYPAAVLGTWPVFVASVVGAMVAGYLGIWWTARNLGLSPQLAILPGLTFATTPYVLSEIYGRGAWAELVAVNAAAVALGAATALLWRPRPERSRGPATAALIAASALVAGTHNLTFMVSAIVLPLIVLALLPLRSRALPPVRAELARVALAVGLGLGLTAAWLVPNLWFGPSTLIAHPSSFDNVPFTQDTGLPDITNLFSPLPNLPDQFKGRWIYAQGPTLVAAWSLVAIGLIAWLRRRSADRALTTMAGLSALGLALTVLIVQSGWWPSFPDLLQTVQFTHRLIPYLAIVVALAAAVGLATLAGRPGRWMVGALVAIVVVQVGAGVRVVVGSEASVALPTAVVRHGDLTANSEPASFSLKGVPVVRQFRVVDQPAGVPPNQPPTQLYNINLLTSATARLRDTGRVGDRMLAPVVWSPLVQVTGEARIGGRDARGITMIEVTNTDAAGRWRATVGPGHPWQLTVGRLISLLSAIAILAAGLIGWRRRRRDAAPRLHQEDSATDRAPAVGV
jgi:hypothetical protein